MAKWVKRIGENQGWQNQRLIDQSRHERGVSEITVSLRYDFTTKHATEKTRTGRKNLDTVQPTKTKQMQKQENKISWEELIVTN